MYICKKYITMKRNINELNGDVYYIDNVCGYDIYLPKSHFNPISYLKKNCPIWIKIDEDGECVVIFLTTNNEEKNEQDIKDYILQNLPHKPYIDCKNLLNSNYHPLSCIAVDEEGVVCAEIIITESSNSLTVESVSYDNEESLLKLRRYLLSERNIKLYPAIVLTFSKTISNDVIRLMGAIYNEEYEAYIQQLI